MASSARNTATYYLTPTELSEKVAGDPGFYNIGVKVGADVVDGTIVRAPSGREVSFRVTDGVTEYPVVYRGVIPDTFTEGVEVVVEGRLHPDGTFHATTLLAKCASRYENAPEQHVEPAGYPQRPS